MTLFDLPYPFAAFLFFFSFFHWAHISCDSCDWRCLSVLISNPFWISLWEYSVSL